MHPSLLPKYRGACPIQHAILNREKETGVSVIEISKGKFDAGGIVYQASIEMNEGTRFQELSEELGMMGGQGVLEVLRDLEGCRARKLLQDPKMVSSARMIKNEFGIIKFSELKAE